MNWILFHNLLGNKNSPLEAIPKSSSSAISAKSTLARTPKQLTSCLDQDKYCGLVRHFEMCHKEKYKIQCCKSCMNESWRKDINNIIIYTYYLYNNKETTKRQWKMCIVKKRFYRKEISFHILKKTISFLFIIIHEDKKQTSCILLFIQHNKCDFSSRIDDSCRDTYIITMAVIYSILLKTYYYYHQNAYPYYWKYNDKDKIEGSKLFLRIYIISCQA